MLMTPQLEILFGFTRRGDLDLEDRELANQKNAVFHQDNAKTRASFQRVEIGTAWLGCPNTPTVLT